MPKFLVSVRMVVEAESDTRAREEVASRVNTPVKHLLVTPGSGLNMINETGVENLIRAISNLRQLQKIVKCLAYCAVKFGDSDLDSIVNGLDDGNGEDLLGAYNEGFNIACYEDGKEFGDVLDDWTNPIRQMAATLEEEQWNERRKAYER
jgi:hypothetical protein